MNYIGKKIVIFCVMTVSIFSKCNQLELQSLKNVDLTQPYMQPDIDILSLEVADEARKLDTLLHTEHTRTNKGLEAIFKVMFIGTLYTKALNTPEPDESKKRLYEDNLRRLIMSLLYYNFFSYSCPNTSSGGKVRFLQKEDALKELVPGSLRKVLITTLADIIPPMDCPLHSGFGKVFVEK